MLEMNPDEGSRTILLCKETEVSVQRLVNHQGFMYVTAPIVSAWSHR